MVHGFITVHITSSGLAHRVNVDHVVRYTAEGPGSEIFVTNQQLNQPVIVNETPADLDAAINAARAQPPESP